MDETANGKCLFCFGTCSKEGPLLIKDDIPGSANCPPLKIQLQNYFILQKILDCDVVKLLRKNIFKTGNGGDSKSETARSYLKICKGCLEIVEEAWRIHQLIVALQAKFESKKCKLKDVMSREVSKAWEGAQNDFSLEAKVRRLVFPMVTLVSKRRTEKSQRRKQKLRSRHNSEVDIFTPEFRIKEEICDNDVCDEPWMDPDFSADDDFMVEEDPLWTASDEEEDFGRAKASHSNRKRKDSSSKRCGSRAERGILSVKKAVKRLKTNAEKRKKREYKERIKDPALKRRAEKPSVNNKVVTIVEQKSVEGSLPANLDNTPETTKANIDGPIEVEVQGSAVVVKPATTTAAETPSEPVEPPKPLPRRGKRKRIAWDTGTFAMFKKCELCSTFLRNADSLRNHLELHERRKNSDVDAHLNCKVCAYPAATQKEFNKHMLDSHTPKTWYCPFIGCTFDTPLYRALKRHVLRHDSPINREEITQDPEKNKALLEYEMTCATCLKGFPNARGLAHHWRRRICVERKDPDIESEKQEMVCEDCGASFLGRRALNTHRRARHNTNPRTPRKPKKPSEKFICDTCGIDFCQKQSLDKHYAKYHQGDADNPDQSDSGEIFKCSYCEVSSPYFPVIERHERTHIYSGEIGFKCDQCDKGYCKTANALCRHKRIAHPKEKVELPCPLLCGKIFIHQEYLKDHLRRDKCKVKKQMEASQDSAVSEESFQIGNMFNAIDQNHTMPMGHPFFL